MRSREHTDGRDGVSGSGDRGGARDRHRDDCSGRDEAAELDRGGSVASRHIGRADRDEGDGGGTRSRSLHFSRQLKAVDEDARGQRLEILDSWGHEAINSARGASRDLGRAFRTERWLTGLALVVGVGSALALLLGLKGG